jgi:cytochrome c peroxidase
MTSQRSLVYLAGALALGALGGCTMTVPDLEGDPDDVTATAEQALSHGAVAGKRLFRNALPGTNGRSCATCHVLDEHTVLAPANVEARLAANPQDPLFHPLDADDPAAPVLTFEHLKKGLVRVVLPLPENMDVIDEQGNVITPADRMIEVWRAVPSIADTAVSGPYLYDGRADSLEEQAQAAIFDHSQGNTIPFAQLAQIADFERGVFSSLRARFVAELLGAGVPLDEIPSPEDFMQLSPQERRGRDVYRAACEACHGTATRGQVSNHDVPVIPVIQPDGNITFRVVPGQGPAPVLLPDPDPGFMNVGFGVFTYLGQVGLFPTFNASVALPQYRFRFYTDATRQHAVTELPPIPVTASGERFDLTPALDESGLPIVGPNGLPQWFTTDPGRALITGDPDDFEAFDIPSLRGVAHTAPYFHDNGFASLPEVVNAYSQFILPFLPALSLPPVHPPEFPGAGPEALSPAQKQDLVAFLSRL